MTTFTVARKLPGMGFTITDDQGGRAFSATHHAGLKQERWDVADPQGQLLVTLTLERIHSHPTYVVTLPGAQPINVIRDHAYASTWTLETSSGTYSVVGDTGAYDWKLVDSGGGVVATGQRKVASAHQQYSVKVEGDPALALSVTLAIESERMHGRESAFGPLGQL